MLIIMKQVNYKMKFLSKIRAFFRSPEQTTEMAVSAAEITDGQVVLHSMDDPSLTHCIKSSAVDIIINLHENIPLCDIFPLTPAEEDADEQTTIPAKLANVPQTPKQKSAKGDRDTDDQTRERKWVKNALRENNLTTKTIHLPLYPDEYELLMSKLEETGYRKTEFLWLVSVLPKNPAWMPTTENTLPYIKSVALKSKNSPNLPARTLARITTNPHSPNSHPSHSCKKAGDPFRISCLV